MAQRPIRIATRASKLALWQAHWVRDALLARDPSLDITLLEMTTEGDRFLAAPLAKVGGKGLFVKELETAMLDGRADLAVHSMKDVPVAFPEGLGLSVICAREDPSDAFVAREDVAAQTLEALPAGARVLDHCLLRECVVERDATVGPFTHVRPESRIGAGARVEDSRLVVQGDQRDAAKRWLEKQGATGVLGN